MFPRSLIATYLTLPAAPAMVFAQGGTEAKTGYAALHGLKMYYRIQGADRPLVLLHGALSNIDTDLGEDVARTCEAAAGNRGRATGTRSYRRR